MGLNTSVQQFVERLNDLNRYLLYFPEENPKQLDQDEIIEILDQAKARYPEWHEVMVNANIDIFEMTYEESVSYFKHLENLDKIRRTNSPNPSSLSKSLIISINPCSIKNMIYLSNLEGEVSSLFSRRDLRDSSFQGTIMMLLCLGKSLFNLIKENHGLQ
jgi:hypothetical protein